MEWGEGGNWWVKGAVKKGARDDKRVWGSILGNIQFRIFHNDIYARDMIQVAS